MNFEKDYLKKNFFKNIKLIDIINFIFLVFIVTILNIQILYLIKINDKQLYKYAVLDILVCILEIIEIFYWIRNRKRNLLNQYEIERLKENNECLTEANDIIRCFKHDFNNIIQIIDACIDLEDYNSLKKYFNSLMKECNHMNILDKLNSKAKESPAIYSMLISKYRLAEEKNIKMNIEVLIDLNYFNEKSYQISRVLGILLDNALEACEECDDKTVNVQLYKETENNKVSIIVENTYNNKDIDTNKIFEKNYTTKKGKGNSGLGLWKVNNIISKDMSLDLYTTKDEKIFKQQIEYYNNSNMNFILK